MINEKMSNEEREIANRVVVNSMRAVELINRIHHDCEKLMDNYGWGIDTWDISQAAMLVGKEALSVAHSIGVDDGWVKEETV